MKALLRLIPLAGLILASDAIADSNEVHFISQQSALLPPRAFMGYHERIIAAQRMVSRQATGGQGILIPKPMLLPGSQAGQSRVTEFIKGRIRNTQSNGHHHHRNNNNNNNQHGSHSSGFRQNTFPSKAHPLPTPTVILQDSPVSSSSNFPPNKSVPSPAQRTPTTLVNQAPNTSNPRQAPRRPAIVPTPRTTRPSGTFGGLHPATSKPPSIVYYPDSKPQRFDPTTVTPRPTLKPVLVQDRRDPVSVAQASKPSSNGQGHKLPSNVNNPSSSDPGESHRNPVCYNEPNYGNCRAAFPRYYFDRETGTCNCYLYGGCDDEGDEPGLGTYSTLEQCHQDCHPPKSEEGPVCKDLFQDDPFSILSQEASSKPQNKFVDSSHLDNAKFIEALSI